MSFSFLFLQIRSLTYLSACQLHGLNYASRRGWSIKAEDSWVLRWPCGTQPPIHCEPLLFLDYHTQKNRCLSSNNYILGFLHWCSLAYDLKNQSPKNTVYFTKEKLGFGPVAKVPIANKWQSLNFNLNLAFIFRAFSSNSVIDSGKCF
jgi:hypothetical protein